MDSARSIFLRTIQKELLYLDSADTLQIFKALVFQPCKIFSGRPAHVTSRVRVGVSRQELSHNPLKLRRQSLPCAAEGTGKQSLNTGKGIGDKAVNLPPRPLIMASLHAPVKILPVNLSCVGTDGIPVKIFKAFVHMLPDDQIRTPDKQQFCCHAIPHFSQGALVSIQQSWDWYICLCKHKCLPPYSIVRKTCLL